MRSAALEPCSLVKSFARPTPKRTESAIERSLALADSFAERMPEVADQGSRFFKGTGSRINGAPLR
jgi:hypothetical protein